MKISIIGAGYVGLITGAVFSDWGNEVMVMDIDERKVDKLSRGIIPIHEPGLQRIIDNNAERLFFTTSLEEAVAHADCIVLTVWTPPRESGEADLSAIDAVAAKLGELFAEQHKEHPIVVTKSTVPVGTNDRIREQIAQSFKKPFAVVSNPEFLREGQAVADMMRPDRVVIGADDAAAGTVVSSLYETVSAPKIHTDVRTAEMIKYAANAFLATKISFINEVANVCERVGADVDTVAHAIGLDKRIGPSFLRAGIGYGGSCFPKDVRALQQFANHKGYDFKLLKAVIEVNAQQRQLVVQKLLQHLESLADADIYVLGLAFKPHTDDIRESAAIDIITQLCSLGARVRAHDPAALLTAQQTLGDQITYFARPLEGAKGADAIVVATEWPDFRDLEWATIKKHMRTPLIVDGRNLLDPAVMREHGFVYEGVGRRNA